MVEIDEMDAGAPDAGDARAPSRHRQPDVQDHAGTRCEKRPLMLVAAECGGAVVAPIVPTHDEEAIASPSKGNGSWTPRR